MSKHFGQKERFCRKLICAFNLTELNILEEAIKERKELSKE